MPSPAMRSDSSEYGRLQRLTMNPGASLQRTGARPIRSATSTVAASAGSPVDSPATTSTSFISAGGLKKCMPQILSGRPASAAIALTESEEVLVASTASALHAASRRANRSRFSPSSSGAASTTTPAGPRSSTAAARRTRVAAASASSAPHRPRSAPRARSARSRSRPRSSASGCGS